MKKILLYLPLGIVCLLLLCLMVRGGLNYSGYCWEQKRWLSDEEYIEAAASLIQKVGPSYNSIDYKNYDYEEFANEKEGWLMGYDVYDPKRWNTTPDGGMFLKEEEQNRDVQEFFQQYPNCCKIVDRNDSRFIRSPSFWEKVYGLRAAIVEIISDVTLYNPEKEDRKTLNNLKSYVAIENCGVPNQDANWQK